MALLRFLQSQSRLFGPLLLIAAIASGLANIALLAIIDHVMKAPKTNGVEWAWALSFLAVLILLLGTSWFMHGLLIRITQHLIARIRLQIIDRLRQATFMQFEGIGQEKVYAALTKDTTMVGNLGPNLVYGLTSAITVIVCFGFLAYLSWIAFAAAVLFTGLAVGLYLLRDVPITRLLEAGRDKENEFLKYLDQLLKGFKEVKMDQQRNDDLYQNYIRKVAESNRDLSRRAFIGYVNNGISATAFFFLLLGFILFAFPVISLGSAETVVASCAIIILYMYGPIEGIINLIPAFSAANVSFRRLQALEKDIQAMASTPGNALGDSSPFQSIEFEGVCFDYRDAEGNPLFRLGPIDLTLHAGQTLFIVGGNGSGKSTFIRLLTGLYTPTSGRILLNGLPLHEAGFQQFRTLISPIFSDYFLFDRFYGRDHIDEAELNRLLRQMQLEGKVEYRDGRFSTLDLSSGQRKRLAMVAALLDHKPFYIFDEWAADQDPEFRRFFYEQLLRELKSKGKTILAVTHDDRYFHIADRVLRMESGRLEG